MLWFFFFKLICSKIEQNTGPLNEKEKKWAWLPSHLQLPCRQCILSHTDKPSVLAETEIDTEYWGYLLSHFPACLPRLFYDVLQIQQLCTTGHNSSSNMLFLAGEIQTLWVVSNLFDSQEFTVQNFTVCSWSLCALYSCWSVCGYIIMLYCNV